MRFRKKKASPPMEDLVTFIESVLAAAGGSCTQCLIDDLGNESAELADSIARLQTAHLMRDILPAGEEELTDAFGEFLARVTKMAMFTAELMHRPGVGWTDESTETGSPVIVISPN
jgi:hypothetical protein